MLESRKPLATRIKQDQPYVRQVGKVQSPQSERSWRGRQSPGRLRLTDLAQSEIVHDFSDFFPSFPTRSVRKSCFLPEIQSICRAKCRATSEQIPAVEVVMVMCFEDALSDDSMMKLDWNYLGWAAMFPTSFAGSSLNCAERASVKILKFQFQQIQKP